MVYDIAIPTLQRDWPGWIFQGLRSGEAPGSTPWRTQQRCDAESYDNSPRGCGPLAKALRFYSLIEICSSWFVFIPLTYGVQLSNLLTKLVPLVIKDKYSPSGLKPDDFELYVDDCLAPADATLRNLIALHVSCFPHAADPCSSILPRSSPD